jgi:hypothetical protein
MIVTDEFTRQGYTLTKMEWNKTHQTRGSGKVFYWLNISGDGAPKVRVILSGPEMKHTF